jgi:site-specific DNA-methyltransferase (adenine-specific)
VGGVLVWIVADQVKEGTESGASFRHALFFIDHCKLNLHQTMLYCKTGGPNGSLRAYYKRTEYMFVFAKGMLRTFHPICDIKTVHAGLHKGGGRMDKNGIRHPPVSYKGPAFGKRTNVWTYNPANHIDNPEDHPAPFPETLACDHIVSWSDPTMLICDPFYGSGTTGVACIRLGRRSLGIEQSEVYCAMAVRRMEKELRQPSLFPPAAPKITAPEHPSLF